MTLLRKQKKSDRIQLSSTGKKAKKATRRYVHVFYYDWY